MQATVGGGKDRGRAVVVAHNGDAVHVARYQPLVEQHPGSPAIGAAINAADFDRRPDGVAHHRIEQDLGDPRRPHIGLGELADAGCVEFLPALAGIGRAVKTGRPRSGDQHIGVFRILHDGPDILHRRRQRRPARRGLVPAEHPHVGTGKQIAGRGDMACDGPDACFKIHARVAVWMDPGLAAILTEPSGVAGRAGIYVNRLLAHGGGRLYGTLNYPTIWKNMSIQNIYTEGTPCPACSIPF